MPAPLRKFGFGTRTLFTKIDVPPPPPVARVPCGAPFWSIQPTTEPSLSRTRCIKSCVVISPLKIEKDANAFGELIYSSRKGKHSPGWALPVSPKLHRVHPAAPEELSH